ncbi:hypothetical protein GMOD_00007194 [Pyrenophora seminiperda CCB06]|uniref:Uncharacterized protein n=1 Tax=Pyrenophora seminiperda CCB06 TaxID=1302712 RepID=A0A3M7MCI3_9PLEO|nr:hypothetical protein GMOD_00007194 [Pyrenophora seminiperda CCB06]
MPPPGADCVEYLPLVRRHFPPLIPPRCPVQQRPAVPTRLDESVATCFGTWHLETHWHPEDPSLSLSYIGAVPLDARGYHSNDTASSPRRRVSAPTKVAAALPQQLVDELLLRSIARCRTCCGITASNC